MQIAFPYIDLHFYFDPSLLNESYTRKLNNLHRATGKIHVA